MHWVIYPQKVSSHQLEQLGKYLHHISKLAKNNPNPTLFLGGDFTGMILLYWSTPQLNVFIKNLR